MKELIHRLFPFAKLEVHRVLVPRISTRCFKVAWPTGELQPPVRLVDNKFGVISTIRRLSMKAVTFESLSIFSPNCHLFSPQIDTILTESIDCATVKANQKLVIPSIFSYVNPSWKIGTFRVSRFKLKHTAIQRLLSDDFEGFDLPITCHKFTSALVTPIAFPFVNRTKGIISSQVNQIDSNELVVSSGIAQFFYSHLNESKTVKFEVALQMPHCSILEVSELSTTLIEFERLAVATIETRHQVFDVKIALGIQSWGDYNSLICLKILDHTDTMLPPALCERYGISWRFFNEKGNEFSAFNIARKIIWFKLSDKSLNRGRLANRITAGIYLLVVPANWECLNLTSPCFVFQEQELLAVDRWQGYLIHVHRNPEDFPRFKTDRGVELTCNWISVGQHAIHLHHFDTHQLRWGIANIHCYETRISWQNKPIEIEESRFAATSSEALWVRIPKTSHINSVYAGFKPRKLRRKKGTFGITLYEFYKAAAFCENDATFYLWIRDSTREHKVAILKIIWHCKIADCSFASANWEKAESHFKKFHLLATVRDLSDIEAQEKGLNEKELPKKIYQCPYNPKHIIDATSTFSNPNSLMTHHIERVCQNAREHARSERIKIHFKVIEDAEKIRQIYLDSLPKWIECLFCQKYFKKSEDGLNEEVFAHLLQTHRKEIFEWK